MSQNPQNLKYKECKNCGNFLPIEDFPIENRKKKNGEYYSYIRPYCKKCSSKLSNEWRKKNLDKNKEYSAKYRDKNREKIRELNRKRYHDNPEVKQKQADRQKMLPKEFRKSASARSKYKLSVDEYLSLPKACEVCGSTDKLSIDHDHNTGKVRGILCYRCNVALGFMAEDESRALGLAQYIRTKCAPTLIV